MHSQKFISGSQKCALSTATPAIKNMWEKAVSWSLVDFMVASDDVFSDHDPIYLSQEPVWGDTDCFSFPHKTHIAWNSGMKRLIIKDKNLKYC